MFSISHSSITPNTTTTALTPNQPNTKTDLVNSTSVVNQLTEIKNMSEPNAPMKRKLGRAGLTLDLSSVQKPIADKVLSGFQKLEKKTDKHSDNYISVASSRYPDIKTAVETQISIKDEATGELIPLPANYLQVAGKNIAIRTQYPKNTELSIEQHLKMLMAEKPSVLVVIASQNDIDGADIQNVPEKSLPLYFSHDASYGSVEIKSEANSTLEYTGQVSADNYQLTLTKDGHKVTLPVIHIINWNDRTTISAEALRALTVDINQYSKGEGELPVIHCISGSGRTGSVVAAMQLTKPNNQYSAYQVVESLRNTGTPHMIQTEEQYRALTEIAGKIT